MGEPGTFKAELINARVEKGLPPNRRIVFLKPLRVWQLRPVTRILGVFLKVGLRNSTGWVRSADFRPAMGGGGFGSLAMEALPVEIAPERRARAQAKDVEFPGRSGPCSAAGAARLFQVRRGGKRGQGAQRAATGWWNSAGVLRSMAS